MHTNVHAKHPHPRQNTSCHGFRAGVLLSHHQTTPAFLHLSAPQQTTARARPYAPVPRRAVGASSGADPKRRSFDGQYGKPSRVTLAYFDGSRSHAAVGVTSRSRPHYVPNDSNGPNGVCEIHPKKLTQAKPTGHNTVCHGFQAGVLLSHLPPLNAGLLITLSAPNLLDERAGTNVRCMVATVPDLDPIARSEARVADVIPLRSGSGNCRGWSARRTRSWKDGNRGTVWRRLREGRRSVARFRRPLPSRRHYRPGVPDGWFRRVSVPRAHAPRIAPPRACVRLRAGGEPLGHRRALLEIVQGGTGRHLALRASLPRNSRSLGE